MVARNRVAWSKGPLKPYEPVPSVPVHWPACGPSRPSTRAPLSGRSALSYTIPASCVVLAGTGGGASGRAAVGVEGEPPHPPVSSARPRHRICRVMRDDLRTSARSFRALLVELVLFACRCSLPFTPHQIPERSTTLTSQQ